MHSSFMRTAMQSNPSPLGPTHFPVIPYIEHNPRLFWLDLFTSGDAPAKEHAIQGNAYKADRERYSRPCKLGEGKRRPMDIPLD